MDLETLLAVICLGGAVVCRIVYRYCSENVYLKYKEQKVGVRTKRWRK